MSDLLSAIERPDHHAAIAVFELLANSTPLTRQPLNGAMIAAFGGTDATGHWTQRDSFEVLEHALALHLRQRPYQLVAASDVI